MTSVCQVHILEREQEGDIIKCRCRILAGQLEGAGISDTVFAFIKSSLPANSDVGADVTVCSPWKLMRLSKSQSPLLFVTAAHN
jgi:hypothetical protein